MSNPNVLVTYSGGDFTLALQNGFLQVGTLPYGGGVGNITLTGDVTGTGPTTDVVTALAWPMTTVPGNGTATLSRARVQSVVLLGPNCTVNFPAAPVVSDLVFVSSVSNVGDVGAAPNVMTNGGGGQGIEIPTAPGSFGTSVPIIDGLFKCVWQFNGTGSGETNNWSLVFSNVTLSTFAGTNSPAVSGATTQATWAIDPQNVSGTASDANSGEGGVGSTVALLSFREVVRRWGSNRPVLNQVTTVTYLSSGTAADTVDVQAKGEGALVFQGPGSTGTPLFSGVIAGHVAFSTATGIPESITAYAGAAVGQMVVNTTRANSVAFVLAVSGGVATLAQPQAPSTVSGAGAPVTTWANGDAIHAFVLPAVFVARASYEASAFASPAGVAFQHLNVSGLFPWIGGGFSSWLIEATSVGSENGMGILRSGVQTIIYNGAHVLRGGPSSAGPLQENGNDGVVGVLMTGGGVIEAFDVDTFYAEQNVTFACTGTCRSLNNDGGILQLPSTALNVSDGCYELAGAVHSGGGSEGTAAILNMTNSARCAYGSTATATFLASLILTLNDETTGFSRTAAGTWAGGITINVTNLDAAAGVAGFGGLAFSPVGSACYAKSLTS